MVQDEVLAEDISQEVFITIYKSILSFNQQSSLSTWIYRITVNKCLDQLRSQKRLKQNGFFNMLFQKGSDETVDKPVFEHPGVQLEQKEQSKHLFAAIETLPGNQKTVFVLAHIEELPQKDIAEIMNLSLKAVESLLQRAKINLRKKLSDIYDRRKAE